MSKKLSLLYLTAFTLTAFSMEKPTSKRKNSTELQALMMNKDTSGFSDLLTPACEVDVNCSKLFDIQEWPNWLVVTAKSVSCSTGTAVAITIPMTLAWLTSGLSIPASICLTACGSACATAPFFYGTYSCMDEIEKRMVSDTATENPFKEI